MITSEALSELPNEIVSLPSAPVMMSAPPAPSIVSSPDPDVIVSPPAPPVIDKLSVWPVKSTTVAEEARVIESIP